jgi:uncharacterized iron-regulated membrane protein
METQILCVIAGATLWVTLLGGILLWWLKDVNKENRK